MENKIKFGIVGCGRIAERHAEHITNLGILSAVCDIDDLKADKFAKQFKTQSYYSLEDMLRDIGDCDVISICSPNGLHAEHSIMALSAGFHVLCEKPMAINSYDAGQMMRIAESNNKRLFVIKQNRFNPPVAAIKEAIDKGYFGKIFNVQLNCFWNRNFDYYLNSWKGTKELDGGTLFTQFSHFVDLLYWLIGDVIAVEAFADNFAHKSIIEFEDTGVVILKFRNDAIGAINYTVNSYGKNMEGSLTIFGEKGTVKIGGQYLNELEYQNFENYSIENLPEGNKANNYGSYQGSMSNHDLVYQNVIDVLTKGASISTNSFEGLKTVEIIEKIYKKIHNEL
jgi:UDP-N-acetyl-2-amino-2-deoxyglucuronate dehydrogenase